MAEILIDLQDWSKVTIRAVYYMQIYSRPRCQTEIRGSDVNEEIKFSNSSNSPL